MGINKIMRNALNTNWTRTDDFMFQFSNAESVNVSGGNMTMDDVFNMCIINIDLPQLGSEASSVMQAGEWRIYNAKFQPFSFSVTFRDFGSLDLRNYFSKIWMNAQRGYYDDVKSTISISMNGKNVFKSSDCLITGVSQVQLDNNNAAVAEFTVEFSTPYYSNDTIDRFGSEAYFSGGDTTLTSGEYRGKGNTISSNLSSLKSIVGTVSSWL